MNEEELKALLAKADANYQAIKAKADLADVRMKDAEAKADGMAAKFESQKVEFEKQAAEHKTEMENLKNEIADVEVKFKGFGGPVDQKQQKEQLATAFKNAIGAFVKSAKTSDAQKDASAFKNFVNLHIKAALNLTTTAQGLESIDEVLSREIIERARESYPILGAVGMRNMPRSLREEVLISYPSVQQGIENVAGTTISQTEVQHYDEVVNQVAKVNAKPRITDEAMVGGDLDLYGHLLRLLDDEIGRYLLMQILYGNGATKNMRGILSSSRLNITNVTGESFKPTFGAGARSPDFYPAVGTGVSGGLPATDKATVDWLIDLESLLPTKYLMGAKWYMNRRTLAKVKKLRDADDRPIFALGYMGERMSILGYPVVIDDNMPEFNVANAPFLIFGKLEEAFYISPGDIDSMLLDPYTVDGCTLVKVNKEYFEIVGKNDAIIIGAATTAAAA